MYCSPLPYILDKKVTVTLFLNLAYTAKIRDFRKVTLCNILKTKANLKKKLTSFSKSAPPKNTLTLSAKRYVSTGVISE